MRLARGGCYAVLQMVLLLQVLQLPTPVLGWTASSRTSFISFPRSSNSNSNKNQQLSRQRHLSPASRGGAGAGDPRLLPLSSPLSSPLRSLYSVQLFAQKEDSQSEQDGDDETTPLAATTTNMTSSMSNTTEEQDIVSYNVNNRRVAYGFVVPAFFPETISSLQAQWANSTVGSAVTDSWQTATETLHRIKWAIASFFAGIVLACAALFIPIHNTAMSFTNSVWGDNGSIVQTNNKNTATTASADASSPILSPAQRLFQPVTLFETILRDLEQAYVDPIDTNKLFETGMAAMLRSLDPYTEFEGPQEAMELNESIDGKYGGVGLVISGVPTRSSSSSLAPPNPNTNNNEGALSPPSPTSSSGSTSVEDDEAAEKRREEERLMRRAQNNGIKVVSAFEGFAFDYGMRVGDRLVSVDDTPIVPGTTTVEQVRNALRGEPGTSVTISFERDGVEGIQTITMPRSVVRIRDVKLATLLGNPTDGIGYIQLSGFASDAGREMRNAIRYLQHATEDATAGARSLQGLILDLRGNPGGLLTSAVDVTSLLVPKGSDIVSARGRGFPGILYRSRVDPILSPQTKLVVLVNGNTASAAEIVSGAVQDLDVGLILGSDRTYGKGLVQNVEELPFQTALKFTVAKYYTPSGRCIQGVQYDTGYKNSKTIASNSDDDGEGEGSSGGGYVARKVADQDRATFYTTNGRVVKDGGGIEADVKVPSQKASALEITLLRSGVLNEFAAEWSKTHELTNNFEVSDDTYRSFQAFVQQKQKSGDLQLEALYTKPLSDLRKALKQSGYKGAEKNVEQLQARIVKEIENDFVKYRNDIKEDISQTILARYLPESMLIERGVKSDKQVQAAVELLSQKDTKQFDTLLARSRSGSGEKVDNGGVGTVTSDSVNVANVAAVAGSGTK